MNKQKQQRMEDIKKRKEEDSDKKKARVAKSNATFSSRSPRKTDIPSDSNIPYKVAKASTKRRLDYR